VDGWHYHVSADAVAELDAVVARSGSDGVAAVRDMSTEVPVPDARDSLGPRGIQQAAKDAGAPRSASTARRWARQNRIPNERVAELVQRRAFVARRGGPDRLAAELGVPVARVRRWQSGRTDTMRGAAGAALHQARLADARERAGLAGITGARLKIRAQVQYRSYGSISDEYRGARTIDIDIGPDAAQALADALADDDYAQAAAICETAWSEWYHHDYSDQAGVHMLNVEDFDIEWQ
jgi:hypothetical protein